MPLLVVVGGIKSLEPKQPHNHTPHKEPETANRLESSRDPVPENPMFHSQRPLTLFIASKTLNLQDGGIGMSHASHDVRIVVLQDPTTRRGRTRLRLHI
jgi:hypothetical protein